MPFGELSTGALIQARAVTKPFTAYSLQSAVLRKSLVASFVDDWQGDRCPENEAIGAGESAFGAWVLLPGYFSLSCIQQQPH